MAESVDALVSNTSGATHPGSSPGPGTQTADNLMVVCRFFISTAIKGQHLHQCNKRSLKRNNTFSPKAATQPPLKGRRLVPVINLG